MPIRDLYVVGVSDTLFPAMEVSWDREHVSDGLSALTSTARC